MKLPNALATLLAAASLNGAALTAAVAGDAPNGGQSQEEQNSRNDVAEARKITKSVVGAILMMQKNPAEGDQIVSIEGYQILIRQGFKFTPKGPDGTVEIIQVRDNGNSYVLDGNGQNGGVKVTYRAQFGTMGLTDPTSGKPVTTAQLTLDGMETPLVLFLGDLAKHGEAVAAEMKKTEQEKEVKPTIPVLLPSHFTIGGGVAINNSRPKDEGPVVK